MRLTVVLVNWRDTSLTIRCAKALKAWHEVEPRLLIVDNQSTPQSQAALEAEASADELIVSPVNLGYGGGNNRGILKAERGPQSAILLLNADAEISEAAAERLLHRLETDPDLAVVGPVLYENPEGTMRVHVGGRDIAEHLSTRVEADPSELGNLPGYPLVAADYVPGTVFMARGSVFDDVGLLDERYFFSGEIADFCKRARDRGHRLCVDLETRATHASDRVPSATRSSLYLYYNIRNRFLYVRKHRPDRRGRDFLRWSTIAAREAVAATLHGDFGRARAALLAMTHGLAGRYGDQNGRFL